MKLSNYCKQERYSYDPEAVMEDADDGGKRNCRSAWSINTAPTNGSHIAGFPQELVESCILASTKPGDLVLDPFFGCGTVGLVAVRLKRQCIGVELNPVYLNDASKLLERQAQTAEPLRRQVRYSPKQNGHQSAFLETSGKRRNVS